MKNPCLVTFFTFPLFLWELDTFKVRIAMALNDLRRFFGRGKALKDLVALIGWSMNVGWKFMVFPKYIYN